MKKEKESFKEYARRWRGVAARVRPQLTEREMTGLFISTLRPPYVNHLLACASLTFADMVATGDKIEDFIRRGIISPHEQSESNRKPTPKKREADVANIITPTPQPYTYTSPSLPQNYTANMYATAIPHNQRPYAPPPQQPFPPQNYVPPPTYPQQQRPPAPQQPNARPRVQFPPLPASQALIFQQLLAANGIRPIPPPAPLQPPYPAWHNPNVTCEYHSNAPGHTTEDCTHLRRKLQWMVHNGQLTFSTPPPTPPQPNIQTNPLPNH